MAIRGISLHSFDAVVAPTYLLFGFWPFFSGDLTSSNELSPSSKVSSTHLMHLLDDFSSDGRLPVTIFNPMFCPSSQPLIAFFKHSHVLFNLFGRPMQGFTMLGDRWQRYNNRLKHHYPFSLGRDLRHLGLMVLAYAHPVGIFLELLRELSDLLWWLDPHHRGSVGPILLVGPDGMIQPCVLACVCGPSVFDGQVLKCNQRLRLNDQL